MFEDVCEVLVHLDVGWEGVCRLLCMGLGLMVI